MNGNIDREIKIIRGSIFFADLGEDNIIGSEQRGQRPVIILSNDIGNKYSPTVLVAVLTSQLTKAKLPTHVEISTKFGLLQDSVALVEQTRVIDKKRLMASIGMVDEEIIEKLNRAVEVAFGVGEFEKKSKIKNIIDEKIYEIHSLELTINTLQERGMLSEATFNSLYTERGHKLDVLEKFCRLNDLNYLDYYKPVNYRKKNFNVA